MIAKTFAAIAFAASTLLISASAEAHDSNKHWRKQHGHHHNWSYYHRYDRLHFGFYIGDYDAYRGCGYLERKARYTGSSYWWRKYKRCVVRYY